jgi:hypothetical protein
MVQVVESLPNKCEAKFKPQYHQKKKKRRKEKKLGGHRSAHRLWTAWTVLGPLPQGWY